MNKLPASYDRDRRIMDGSHEDEVDTYPWCQGYAAYWDAYDRIGSNTWEGEQRREYNRGWFDGKREDEQ